MKYYNLFLALGIWIIIIPLIGFPLHIFKIISLVTGFIVIFMAVLSYQGEKKLQKTNIKASETVSINSGNVINGINVGTAKYEKI